MQSLDFSICALTVLASAALSFLCLILFRPMLVRYALARPNARSSHAAPTPQGGGLAVVAATIIVSAGMTAWLGFDNKSLLPLFGAAILIAVVGMIDDIMAMAVLPRLAAQVAVIAVVIAALPSDLSIVPWLPWWIERVLLLVAILWFVNLVNFMDGIDWMMVTEVVPITVALVVAGYLGALPLHATIVAATLLGAMIGFAPFNKPVARLFLGDVGSLPIGLLLGYLLVLLATRGHLAATLLLPLYFLADASITLVRRVWRRERFWKPHRAHFYQRALDNGMPIGAILISVFTTNLVLAVLAIVTVLNDVRTVDIVCLVTGGIFVAGLLLRLSRSHA